MSDQWISGFEPWFLRAATAWARTDEKLAGPLRALYFQTRLRCIDSGWYRKLATKLAAETPSGPKVVAGDQDNSLALSPIHFVYMDVGCWAGDGKPGWTKHREFGVVCGHLVVLCTFSKEPDYTTQLKPPRWIDFQASPASTPMIDAVITRHPDYPPVKAFLDGLAAGASSIGELHILGATLVTSGYVPVPPSGAVDPIRVFLGDLHAPVATSLVNAHIVENGQEMLRGRLNLASGDATRPSAFTDDAASEALASVGRLPGQIAEEMNWEATSSSDVIDQWMQYYHAPARRTADIFQGAGQDLRTFVDCLRVFHQTTWPLHVVQLGDFFDLWLGFQRGFHTSADDLLPNALDFARLWVERTLFAADQGSHLTHLLALSETAGRNQQTGASLQTHFLYGNHDNYRKHGGGQPITVPVGLEHQGQAFQVFRAPARLELPGLWAEHGHQPDSSNRDENPSFGHRLTQLAFFEPGIRTIEGFGSWTAARGHAGEIPRTMSIQHAMEKCLLRHIDSAEPCRGIYVMGHSHEPMLKRVELWPVPPKKS